MTIACFGLSFKPNIDDLRESPAMHITKMVANWNPGKTYAVEPHIHELPTSLKGISELVSIEKAVNEADVILMLVDHNMFKGIQGSAIPQKWVVDTKEYGVETHFNHWRRRVYRLCCCSSYY
ncbi:hypothetical protein J4731_07045 [Providencia rettgeri]|nr:hypothetical protein [Providencia rettgeri]